MDGGVSRNDFLMQLISDLTLVKIERPGSVERKVQEETVVMFYDLLNEAFGSLDNLEQLEKEGCFGD